MKELEWYLVEIVDPTLEDFDKHPTSRRHAFLACVVTCHAVDYISYPADPRSLRQQFERQSAAFKLVNDIGHAFKHVVQGRRSVPRMKQSDVIERPPFYWGVAVWGLSRWDDEVGGVTLESDKEVDLLETVHAAVDFLWSKVEAAVEQLAQPNQKG